MQFGIIFHLVYFRLIPFSQLSKTDKKLEAAEKNIQIRFKQSSNKCALTCANKQSESKINSIENVQNYNMSLKTNFILKTVPEHS